MRGNAFPFDGKITKTCCLVNLPYPWPAGQTGLFCKWTNQLVLHCHVEILICSLLSMTRKIHSFPSNVFHISCLALIPFCVFKPFNFILILQAFRVRTHQCFWKTWHCLLWQVWLWQDWFKSHTLDVQVMNEALLKSTPTNQIVYDEPFWFASKIWFLLSDISCLLDRQANELPLAGEHTIPHTDAPLLLNVKCPLQSNAKCLMWRNLKLDRL